MIPSGEMMTIIAVLSLATIASSCRPVLYIPGLFQAKMHVNIVVRQLQKLPGCDPNGRNVTVVPGPTNLTPMWDQVKKYQELMKPYFKENPDGIHVIGYSQGSLIARTVIQITNNHHVHSLITVAGIHMGLSGLPVINSEFLYFNKIREVFGLTLDFHRFIKCYNRFGQKWSLCNYWRVEKEYEQYLKENVYLPFVNNEVAHNDSERYKRNLLKVKNFVMIAARRDELANPWQSGHFGSVSKNNTIIEMEDQPIYKNDTLGLKILNERGAIARYTLPFVEHVTIPLTSTLYENYMLKYLT